MENFYAFFDKRTEEQLDYRALDECIKSIFPRANRIVSWTEEDDINVKNRYRDSIICEFNNKVQFKYKTFGVYVMFH